jgi:hypothetical protein
MQRPIIRGVVALVETLSLAMKAFTISASLAGETEEEQLSSKEIGVSLVIGIGLAVLLFIVFPAVVTNLALTPLFGKNPVTAQPLIWNVVDGVLRVIAFFLYIWAISRIGDIQRVFAYHGAEHKTIHAFEHGVDLEPAAVQRFSTKHVRCGTSFRSWSWWWRSSCSHSCLRAIAAQFADEQVAVLTLLIVGLMPPALVAGLAYGSPGGRAPGQTARSSRCCGRTSAGG